MTIPDPRERPTLSIEEAAELLGIGRSAAYECARRSQLPTLRLGRRLRVPTAELRRLVGIDGPTADQPDNVTPIRQDVG